jgi:hypothetical protein
MIPKSHVAEAGRRRLAPSYCDIGIYHTHPAIPGYNSESFSPEDKAAADQYNIFNYVATAGGQELKYTPDPSKQGNGTVTSIGPAP